MTLRVPNEARDAASLRHFDDPEIVRWLLGAPPQPPDPSSAFAQQLEWWHAGTNAAFSIDAEGHDERVGVTRVMFGLVDPFGFAEIGYILFPAGRGRERSGSSRRGFSTTSRSDACRRGPRRETSRRSTCSSGSASGAKGSRAPGSCSP